MPLSKIDSDSLNSPITAVNLAYTGTLTGGTGVVNLGSGQVYKDASGNVGVGTSSPAQKLDVSGTLAVRNASTSYINTYCSGGGNRDYQLGVNGSAFVFNDITSGTTERARIDSMGQFMVNKTTTSGNSAITAKSFGTDSYQGFNTNNAFTFAVSGAGIVYAVNTTISAISDQRLKENVQDLDVGLNAVMQLKPRKFDWKEDKGKNIKGDRGWVAQEFEQVFPDMIDEWRDPAPEGEEPYKSVRADLIPVLVKAIQELKAIVDAQGAEIAALKGTP